jgi:probable phosphoglycerate mutase
MLETKKIYLIRHGQTGHNHRGIVQGRFVDSKLSRKGHEQARAFFEAYKDVPFEKIYTSTLRRTIETVQPFLDMGIAHERLPGLDEICWGESEGLFANGDNNTKYYHTINQWKCGNYDLRLKGGENPYDVMERQKEALAHITAQPEHLILTCMHGRAMRILLSWITNVPFKNMDDFHHDNLSLYILEFHKGTFTIETRDERSHLQQLK